jgi:TRAP-type C4-dicarboxylate transport system permease small subunit
MENAPSWTEEASRMFFIYAVSFAAGIAYKQNYYVFLDLISNKLSAASDHRLQIATNVLVFILFFIITVFSISFVSIGIGERSPSLGINMAYIFVSILLMASSICFFSTMKLIKLLNKR